MSIAGVMEDQRPYDVLISFGGEEDTRGFTDDLYKALTNRGIQTFINDDKETLSEGNKITPSLVKVIQQAKIAIIVFSDNYASSSFCLEVLSSIVDNFQLQNSKFIFPVFYNINSYDVGKQSGPYYETAFANHEEMLKENKERVVKWRNALSHVADLYGWHFEPGDDWHEFEFIHKIAEEVVRFCNLGRDYYIGLDSRLREVYQLLELKSREVLMVGIHGMGGLGKTIHAETVYNMIADRFEASCFLSNVRESSDRHGLVHLQYMLLSKMTGLKDIQLRDASEGVSVIKQRLHQKKVLLVLDDVDTLEQLEALAGGLDWFGRGSRVIITSRDRSLLAFHRVERRYEAQELNPLDSLELFRHYAFKQGIVNPNYKELLNRAVTYASGNPLALKVISSYLFGQSVEFWQYALDCFKQVPIKNIQQVLRISYDNLKDLEKSVFLDITCCFIGYKLTDVENILHVHYGHHIKIHMEVLIGKSLINISLDGKVTTHPLMERMGKEIVRQESPQDPGRRSRLWFPEDIVKVLKNKKGTSKIEIIHLDSPLIEDEEAIEWDGEAFVKMPNLRILIIRKCHFSKAPKYLPNSLKVLEWWRYPSDKLPSDFDSNQLAIYKLPEKGFKSPKFTGLLQRVYHAEMTWRLVGLMSSVVGLICFTRSPSGDRFIGRWKPFKFFLYGALCATIFTAILFAKPSSHSRGYDQHKTYTTFAVLMIISVYSFFYDKAVNGKPDKLSIVSNAAFALVSLSLHKLINLGFEIGVCSYFLGVFTVQLLTINRMLIFVALCFGCPLFVMHKPLNSRSEIASGGQVIDSSSHSNPNVDSGGQSIDQSSHSNPNVDRGGESTDQSSVDSGGESTDQSSHSNPNVDSSSESTDQSSHFNPNVDSGGQAVDPSSHSNPNVDSGGQAVDPSSHSNPNVDSGGQAVDPSSYSNPNVDSGGQAVDPSSHSNPNVDSGGQSIDPSSHSNPNVDSGGQHVIDIPSEF